ncbi:MAG: protein-tyrosine-phosphatase [Geminicoccaceae bacterium]|nr:MAG: protein-tyrosine-phosphatase [Geminicoccaceae bacterium]
MWERDLLDRRIGAEPRARGFLLALPRPTGPLAEHAAQLAEAGVAALVTLLPVVEARTLGLDLGALAGACAARGIVWAHAPLADFAAPDAAFETVWTPLSPELRASVDGGRGVAFHCRAGLGRSGTVAARLLVELGFAPAEAIARVRRARPGAIETTAQEAHLFALARARGG